MVQVFRFTVFDLNLGEEVSPIRRSTKARIDRIEGAKIVEGTEADLPPQLVDSDGREILPSD